MNLFAKVKTPTICVALAVSACVPTGSAPPYDAGASAPAPTFKASFNIMTAPFEDTFDRPDGGDSAWVPFDAGTAISAAQEAGAREGGLATGEGGAAEAGAAEGGVRGEGGAPATSASATNPLLAHLLGDAGRHLEGAEDAGTLTPSNLGPNWIPAKTNAWRVENGKLCGQGAKNHPVWLNRVLPVNARIEFDATSLSDEGDLKVEVWGDGRSYATSTSYTNATSYLAILGGWKNTSHVLARINEHGTDRKEIKVDKESDDPRQRPVQKGQVYHFKIERTDGKTIRWFVDGLEYLKWDDPQPLVGQGHDHIGFNEWDVKVCFDNVKVTPL